MQVYISLACLALQYRLIDWLHDILENENTEVTVVRRLCSPKIRFSMYTFNISSSCSKFHKTLYFQYCSVRFPHCYVNHHWVFFDSCFHHYNTNDPSIDQISLLINTGVKTLSMCYNRVINNTFFYILHEGISTLLDKVERSKLILWYRLNSSTYRVWSFQTFPLVYITNYGLKSSK